MLYYLSYILNSLWLRINFICLLSLTNNILIDEREDDLVAGSCSLRTFYCWEQGGSGSGMSSWCGRAEIGRAAAIAGRRIGPQTTMVGDGREWRINRHVKGEISVVSSKRDLEFRISYPSSGPDSQWSGWFLNLNQNPKLIRSRWFLI